MLDESNPHTSRWMCIASLKCSYVNGIRSNAVPIAAFKSADDEKRMKNDSFPLKSPPSILAG